MGVIKRITRPGEGPEITSGQVVTAHCTGYGKNNDLSLEFWSTKENDIRLFPRPFSFKVGQGHVIKGLDEGVVGMRLGEVARLICTPDCAFGAGGYKAWGIQPNSVVEFENLIYVFEPMYVVRELLNLDASFCLGNLIYVVLLYVFLYFRFLVYSSQK